MFLDTWSVRPTLLRLLSTTACQTAKQGKAASAELTRVDGHVPMLKPWALPATCQGHCATTRVAHVANRPSKLEGPPSQQPDATSARTATRQQGLSGSGQAQRALLPRQLRPSSTNCLPAPLHFDLSAIPSYWAASAHDKPLRSCCSSCVSLCLRLSLSL